MNHTTTDKVSAAKPSVDLALLVGQSIVAFMLNEEKTWATFLLSDASYHWLEAEEDCCHWHEFTSLSGIANLCRGEVVEVLEQTIRDVRGYAAGCIYTIITTKGNCVLEVREFNKDTCYGADELKWKQPEPYEMTVIEEDFCQ
jgi:hypothetical protein